MVRNKCLFLNEIPVVNTGTKMLFQNKERVLYHSANISTSYEISQASFTPVHALTCILGDPLASGQRVQASTGVNRVQCVSETHCGLITQSTYGYFCGCVSCRVLTHVVAFISHTNAVILFLSGLLGRFSSSHFLCIMAIRLIFINWLSLCYLYG